MQNSKCFDYLTNHHGGFCSCISTFLPLSYRYIAADRFFALAGATDVIDGYLARRFKVVSHLGKNF